RSTQASVASLSYLSSYSSVAPTNICNVTVGPQTTVSVTANTVTYGTAQTFTAAVTDANGPVTAGTITFTDSSTANTLAANVPLNGSGQAVTTTVLGAGSQTILATYVPDSTHLPSANVVSVSVNPAPLTVAANAVSVAYGNVPLFSATLSGFVNG